MNDAIATQTELQSTDTTRSCGPQATPAAPLNLSDFPQEHIDLITRTVPGGAHNVQDIYPLSPLQEGMLFHRLIDERGDTYVLSTLFELDTPRHVTALANALQQVIDRHDVLRTAVLWKGLPRPVQVVYRRATLVPVQIDFDPTRELRQQLDECMRPGWESLDVERAPLMRLQVAQSPHGEGCYAVLQVHHLVCDHQSLKVVVAEALACAAGYGAELPRPAPFRNYVAEARSALNTPAAEAFFCSKLGSVDEPTAPFGLGDVYGSDGGIAEAVQRVEPQLSQRVRVEARRHGVSAARLFHAAWALVVARTCPREDVVFGTVILAARQRTASAQRMLGLSVNTLPLRLQLRGVTADELLEQVNRELTDLVGYQHVPLPVARRCSGLGSAVPLFTTLLNFRHNAADAQVNVAHTPGIRVLARGEAWTNYPITMIVDDVGDGFRLLAQTDRRIDPGRVIGLLHSALQSLTDALEHGSRTPALELTVLPRAELQLLESFNETDTAYPLDRLLHQLIEEQVARSPAALAVVCEGQSLTYTELNDKANQLAWYLRESGVGVDELVGLCMERSLEIVVGLLGILKAGGAYVPLDPSYPAERLAYMLEDAAPRVVLTSGLLKPQLAGSCAHVIALDDDWGKVARHDTSNLDCTALGLRPDQLAYVIYTSGSTGKPKGAMNEHRGVVNRLLWMQQQYGLGDFDRVLQKTPYSFDVSVWEFFWPLLAGARLVVARPRGHQDPEYLVSVIEDAGITTLHFVPSMLQIFLDQMPPGRCAMLRHVVCSGEELPATLQQQFFRLLPNVRLSNLYGPTEAAVDVTFWECAPDERALHVPIGRPIANIRMHVLDRYSRPVPIGVAGEIHIGGVGVGRGYLNRPELTAQRFVHDPFCADPQARLYKTGDLGRWREDGVIEYLGRNDHQVKIRGLRIELGEIEAELARHPGVKEVVVLAREDLPREKRLVAYLIAANAGVPVASELRSHLQAVLPDYMIPSAFVVLERMPLTANGKLDRRALPAPQADSFISQRYEAPQGEVEEVLAVIWRELLRVERVGRHDNFFELGGDSLLIVQLAERLRRIGLSMQLRRMLESPVLADLAQALQNDPGEQHEATANSIPLGCEQIAPHMLPLVQLTAEHIADIELSVPGGAPNIQDIYPLGPLQEGMLFHHLLNERGGDTYVLQVLLAVSSHDALERLLGALQGAVDRHDILRTAVLWEGLPRPVQVVYRRAALRTEDVVLDPERAPLEQLEKLMRAEQKFDLRHAPLLQVKVAAHGAAARRYVLLQFHHLVIDHVTLELVTREVVAELHSGACLPDEPARYRQHVAQAIAYAQSGDAENFFRAKLADVDEPTAPFGVLDVHVDAARIDEAHETLDEVLAQRLRLQARGLGMSAATLFHAAWALVIARTSGRDDIVFGTLLLGRLRSGSQSASGVFINTLPLRVRLQANTAGELVTQTQRELIELLCHEQAPLAVAQRCSGVAGSAPLFTALLNYRHSVGTLQAQWSGVDGIEMLALREQTNYPVTLTVDDFGTGFALNAQTERRIDARVVVACMRTALESLTLALEESPQTPALALSTTSEDERRKLLATFNATQVAYPDGKLIHELFEEQVERTPHEIAVIGGSQHLTYRQLNCRANQLARYLRQHGAGEDRFVGVCAERGIELIVGILGVLKSGSAYVPLDPNYPLDRLEFILADTVPVAVLTQEHLRSTLPAQRALMMLDTHWAEIARESAVNLGREGGGLSSSNLAYVIYTSGSTGQPKGVAIEHRNAVNLICWAQTALPPASFQETLHSTSFNFDLSVYECFVPLATGGTLRVVPNALALTSEPGCVTLVNTVPSAIKGVLDCGALPASTRVVNLAGEALKRDLVERIFENSSVDCVCNLYGPSETTTYSTWVAMPREVGFIDTIGRPIANTQVYILDRHCQLVSVGVSGEIYIGGAGVARGYLNRPELTAQRFLQDPFSGDPQARMYKTGDVGRWRPDGSIEYLGRNDHQVKVRGFRVELGEIEAHLMRMAELREAAVLAREDDPGEKRLVAYVVPRDPADVPSVETLRTHVRTSLPEYLVPSAFVVLDRLPLTPNGKLDRRALPAPDSDAYVTRDYEPPQSEIEELLAGIWQNLLRVERVGRQDNFFELGGHSLLIVQMMEQLRRAGLSAELRKVFEAPTLAELSGVLATEAVEHFSVPRNEIPSNCEAITPAMLPLVELTSEHIDRIAQSVPGGAANIQDIYPLAPLQEGILFHHLLDEGRGDTYVLATLLAVSSREQLQRVIAALQAVIDRHDVLRTAVLWDELPRPVQVVSRQAMLPVQSVELDRSRETGEQLAEWLSPQQQHLDISRAPSMRLRIAEDAASGQWYALLQTHHITFDHVTSETVIAEAVAHLEGRTDALPEALPYRNHVAQSLAYARKHDAAAFFRAKLGDVEEPTAPFGLLDVHGDGTQIREARDQLDAELARRVRAQARRLGVSAATLFHAAWSLVIAHTSGRTDVVFGSVLLGRMQGSLGAQGSLGMFINTLPLRLHLEGVGAEALVRQTQRELIDLLAHEQASLAAAQRCSGVAGTAPLFTALLNYRHSAGSSESQWSTAPGVSVVGIQERTNYPITLSVDDLGEGFALSALTDERIDPSRLTAFVRIAVQSLVNALQNSPSAPALSLPILPDTEAQLIARFNATSAAHSRERLIHELFELQAERTAAAVAVVHARSALSYAELNGRANRLARHLRRKGVRPDQPVGICVERGVDMIVGVLAALKAGGAYLPLDPSYPSERLQYMLADAAPPVVLTQRSLRHVLPATDAEVIDLDGVQSQVALESAENLPASAIDLTSANLLYVIYTSGSTGQPKGTAMPHRAMTNLIEWHRATLDGRVGLRTLQFAALSFDVAFQETFSTLCTGGTLVLLDEAVRRDAAALMELMHAAEIERLFLPPLMLQSLAEHFAQGGVAPSSLRDVITAGEQLRITPEIVAFFGGLAGCRLHNHYGPTETHVVTALTLDQDPRRWPVLPSIGRPIANTQIHILDARGSLAPLGVPGEIYIAGANVARGYRNRPELTAQRFVRDPFAIDPHARMYRSGDLGRWNSDGSVEYLGRNDDQVKIRGFRVELGEIEAQLALHPNIREAAVVAREEALGGTRLVAYVTSRDGGAPSSEELRAHLQALLPGYMVPSAFVILERLPSTPSGKLNRRALPAPDSCAYAGTSFTPPLGTIETTLAEIWQDLLGGERVGRHDNFFELGGHSLLALKLLLRINQSFACSLRVTDIYKSPTLQALAARICGTAIAEQPVDLAREAVLDSSIEAFAGPRRRQSEAILLTGATGFVGRFLLAQLLESTSATVYCLVRARSQRHAAARLKATLIQWDLWRDAFEDRIVALAGDLRAVRLGLEAPTYESLSARLDSIYHCGTSMNHLETYAMAKAANVDAVNELLELATRNRLKSVNYISTLGIFNASQRDLARHVNEQTPVDSEKHWASQGYMASKWVADKMFLLADARGVPCNVFRLGLVWADTQQGRFDELQSVYRVLKSCLLSGYGIRGYRYPMPPTPVDYVARAIVHLAEHHPEGHGVFHLSSPTQSNEGVFERCRELLEIRLELLPYYQWIGEIKRLHQSGRSLPAVPVVEYAFAMDERSFDDYHRNMRWVANVSFDCARTYRELEAAGIVAPVLDDEMLGVCLAGMLERDPELKQLREETSSEVLPPCPDGRTLDVWSGGPST